MAGPNYTSNAKRIDGIYSRNLVGDHTFDLEKELHRNRLFLPRNMTRILAYHEKNRAKGTASGSMALRSSPRILSASHSVSGAKSDSLEKVPGMTPHVTETPQNDSNGQTETLDPLKPVIAPSFERSVVQLDATDHKRPPRRSIRRLQEMQLQDEDAELWIGLVNIRKKLNFKTNVPMDGERPAKRVKIEPTKCECHLTIWDNREGLSDGEPIIRKSQICYITATEQASKNFFVEIDLKLDFVIKANDLKVSVQHRDGSNLEIVDKYFLELKIIPTRTEKLWPPIPILGKSDGEHNTGLGRTVSEKLQGALVARYMHLPQAPAPDVPLSVFFLHKGCTYRTKYGLEVSAIWVKPGKRPAPQPNIQIDVKTDAWALDDDGLLFGRPEPTEWPDRKPKPERYLRRGEVVKSNVRVSYTVDGSAHREVSKELRTATLSGYACPICPSHAFSNLHGLQFHFINYHHKYKFVLEKEKKNTDTDEVDAVFFRISTADAVRPRNPDNPKPDWEIAWTAPSAPFDIAAYINGDHTWVGAPRKRGTTTSAINTLAPDAKTLMRKQNGGFLPSMHVRDFRKPNRRRYPVTKLVTQSEAMSKMYTSISHRHMRLSEEPRSESDDEMESDWFTERHLENLEINAKRRKGSVMELELIKRWDKHRLNEQVEHHRYLSESLTRFVRKQRIWIRDGGRELHTVFHHFLRELRERRVISDQVMSDIQMMIFLGDSGSINGIDVSKHSESMDIAMDDAPPMHAEKSTTATFCRIIPTTASCEAQVEIIRATPCGCCGICTKPILNIIRDGIRCSETQCGTPGVMYHTKCAKQSRKQKLNWTCRLCKENNKEKKGKDRLVDPI